MKNKLKLKGEWYFEVDGSVQGPFFNGFPDIGLNKIAEAIKNLSCPYLVIGDDTELGYVITESFRKQVSIVSRTDNQIRFRTQLLSDEAVGDHEKTCIYVEATDTAQTGTMLNMLTQSWSKASGVVLTVECRITVSEVVS